MMNVKNYKPRTRTIRTDSDIDGGLDGKYIHHGLGSNTKNGSWQTFTRDLEADLQEYESDNEIVSINGFLIRGTGRVDDITTISPDLQITIYEDAEQLKNTQIIYHQNALNQRAAKEVDGVITEKYLWQDLTTLLATYNPDNTLKQRYNYTTNRMPTSMTQDNQKYYLSYDQVGSLRAISDTSHNIIKEVTYDTFGNILNDTNQNFKIPFGFAGGMHDRDTELVHFGYREYDPYTGKWTAKDPIGFDGGDANLYGYVLGDPVNLIDPEGLWSFSVDAYFGRGGGITIGKGSNGWFMDYRFGVGLGGGFSFDPIDNGMVEEGDGTYIGVYCEAEVRVGGLGLSAEGMLGAKNQGGLKPLKNFDLGMPLSDKTGLKAGWSIGVGGGFY